MNKLQAFFKKHFYLFLFLAMCVVAYFYGIERIFDVDFNVSNGDFQSYNVFRRVLVGQAPYVDFANYLGMGAIWVNLPIIALFNNFKASLFATNFTVALLFMAAVYISFYLLTQKRLLAASFALIMPKLISAKIFFLIPYFGYYVNDFILYFLASPGNSLRMVRIFLPFLLVTLAYLLTKGYSRLKKLETPFVISEHLLNTKLIIIFFAIVGFFIVWSNDFGFACLGSAVITYFILLLYSLPKAKKIFAIAKMLSLSVAASLAGAFLSVFLITKGQPLSFLKFTVGVSDYQYWYFGTRSVDKLHSFIELFSEKPFVIFTVLFFVAMAYCLAILLKGKATNRTISFVFCYLSIYLATCIYIYGSGGYHFREALEGFTMIFYTAFFVNIAVGFLCKYKHAERLLNPILLSIVIVYVGYVGYLDGKSTLAYSSQEVNISNDSNYVESLNGTTSHALALNTQASFIGDAPFFSTYATALDLMKGQFQPTGSDYVIHALGDAQREQYINAFLEGNYRYVQTINSEYSVWEFWICRVNWDFYRLLYREYTPACTTSPWVIWEKSDTPNIVLYDNCEVTIEQVTPYTVTLRITTDPGITGTADLHLSYEAGFINNLYRLQTWKKSVFVFDSAHLIQGYFIPTESQNHSVPIVIRNGVGQITIESQPLECTTLTVSDAWVEEIYTYY